MLEVRNAKDERLVELLNELGQVQSQLSVINAIEFSRKTNQTVENAVENKRNYVYEQVQKQGQKKGNVESTILKFSDAIKGVENQYQSEKNLWIYQIGKLEQEEVTKVIETGKYQTELEKLKKQVNVQGRNQQEINEKIEKYEKRIIKDKKLISRYREQISYIANENINDCEKRCERKIQEAYENKALVAYNEKPNFFKRLFGFGGKNSATKTNVQYNAVKQVEMETTYIKKEITQKAKGQIEQNVIPKVKNIYEAVRKKYDETEIPATVKGMMTVATKDTATIIEEGLESKKVLTSALVKDTPVIKESAKLVVKTMNGSANDVTETL